MKQPERMGPKSGARKRATQVGPETEEELVAMTADQAAHLVGSEVPRTDHSKDKK